jgi:serine/threonine protein phosphatase 1
MTDYTIGDLHGRAPALRECLQKCSYDNDNDKLIVLGDICDGYPWTNECFDILEGIKNNVIVRGNHDEWTLRWMTDGAELPAWIHQGGYNTMLSYDFNFERVPKTHVDMIKNAPVYYIDSKNNIYCHGGFIPSQPIEKQSADFILWDRTLCKHAYDMSIKGKEVHIKPYKHVFLGHTSTGFFTREYQPLILGNVVMMDTGGGDVGVVTIMNVDTLKYWQSKAK